MFSTCFEADGSSAGRPLFRMECFTCIGINSLVGRRVWSNTADTDACTTL